MLKWILLFLTIPVAEIVIYIELGHYIGLLPTLALIFGTGIAGAVLARQQGFYTLNTVRREISMGRVPGNQILDGFLILAGAVLLMTPGLLTDLAGFFLLIPMSRRTIREYLKRKILNRIRHGKTGIYSRTH